MLPILLASSSIYRQRQLSQLRLSFNQFSPDIDEQAAPNEKPADLAIRLAVEKARKAAQNLPDNQLIIGCDQVAECNGELLGKPGTTEKAVNQLSTCSGQTVHFHSAICLLNSQSARCQQAVETTSVEFKLLTRPQIQRYIELEPALDCAGSFKVEGLGISLFKSIHSDDPNSLIGLPLIRLIEMLRNEGIDPLG